MQLLANCSGVPEMSLEETGRESVFRPKCGISLHHQGRERKEFELKFSNPLLKMNGNLQPHTLRLVNKMSGIHYLIQVSLVSHDTIPSLSFGITQPIADSLSGFVSNAYLEINFD